MAVGLVCAGLVATAGRAQPGHVDSVLVFSADRDHVPGHDDGVPVGDSTETDMYQTYREPVVVMTNAGRLVVLCHAGNRHRWPERSGQDFVVRFSDDGGATWGGPVLVAEHGNYSMQSHGLVYDAQADRLICLYTLYRWDYSAITGRGAAAAAPAVRATLDRGEPLHKQYRVHSDDGGATWRKSVSILDTDNTRNYSCEARITELPDGSLLYNQRTRNTGRQQARSTDGGETWSALERADDIRASQCNASMLSLRDADGALTDTLLLSVPSPGGRSDGLVYVSHDGGVTWPIARPVVDGAFAYSALVQIDADTVGLFYECNHYRDIRFLRLPLGPLLGE